MREAHRYAVAARFQLGLGAAEAEDAPPQRLAARQQRVVPSVLLPPARHLQKVKGLESEDAAALATNWNLLQRVASLAHQNRDCVCTKLRTEDWQLLHASASSRNMRWATAL